MKRRGDDALFGLVMFWIGVTLGQDWHSETMQWVATGILLAVVSWALIRWWRS